ncbi:hypothetical protein SAMN05443287_101473 [Micromonospora phaseoli]|uniref:Uncharacterized protein n=1 Tax=Micromonospora phaseoli TaxID=1144548 RepID=A0A1H6RYE8_9ACTN|nr:hypothetical protein [Micromonospora phaseoli]PZW03723.1 hypothetical protein CLV64_101473 [Micromonospora phaseoli]GIJ80292.1 hypothetical protein Xph01_47240 [Micromonospora phaseoli]SEI60793.1 hypothetical protein SAMN05443287_101473 [Micromonospora phaseoli]
MLSTECPLFEPGIQSLTWPLKITDKQAEHHALSRVGRFHSCPPGKPARMSSDPGRTARHRLERARQTVQEIHQAAVRHRDPRLHNLADEISEIAMMLGHDAGPVQEWRPCPVCGAEPASHCVNMPGHKMVDGTHPERNRL